MYPIVTGNCVQYDASTTQCSYMWDVASSTAALQTTFANIGIIFLVAITAILLAWASLVGLGFGLRKAKKYVTGKHF